MRRKLALILAGAVALTPVASVSASAQSAAGKLPVVRDAETEELLRDYTAPIFKAAGVAGGAVEIQIINNRSFNAFVANGRRIFVNTGTLLDSKTPNELIGVLAHETAHIAGGHLARLRQQLEAAQNAAIIAMLAGIAGVAAGAVSGASGSTLANVAPAAILAPQHALSRTLLAYARSEEQAADRAALTYLAKTGQSAKGMITVFKRFADQAIVSSRYVDPYVLSHPMPADRVANLEEQARKSPHFDKPDPPALQLRHDMMRAKLVGFLSGPDAVARQFPASDTSLPARYARAVSTYRFGRIEDAVRQIDELIKLQPENGYLHELKGQALLETGHPDQAIGPLRRAVALVPNAPLIRAMLGQALLATDDKSRTEEALRELTIALGRDKSMADAYRQLAVAYGRLGRLPDADLASAQSAFVAGDLTLAKSLALRAKNHFPTGSPGWLRADDIVSYKAPKLD